MLQSWKEEEEREEDEAFWFLLSSNRAEPPHSTFVEVQLLVLLVLALLLAGVLPLLVRLVVVVLRHPLDLAARLLPLTALVRGLGRLLDEVVGLRLGQDGGSLPLEEELRGDRDYSVSEKSDPDF